MAVAHDAVGSPFLASLSVSQSLRQLVNGSQESDGTRGNWEEVGGYSGPNLTPNAGPSSAWC